MTHFLEFSNVALFYYYLCCNTAYLVMLISALHTSIKHQHRLKGLEGSWIKLSPLIPPITILMPARNEEKSISIAIKNLLTLDYSELELIVINDGSSDRTVALLQHGLRRHSATVYGCTGCPGATFFAGNTPSRDSMRCLNSSMTRRTSVSFRPPAG